MGQASRLPGGVGQHSVAARDPRLDETDESAAFAARCAAVEASSRVLDVLGATLLDDPGGPCVVVDRDYPLEYRHGHRTIGHFHSATRSSRQVLPWFLRQPGAGLFADPTPLFFDLETTGLSGGAGTYAFLVGFGFFDADRFHTRQFFLRGYGEERPLLHAVTRQVTGGAGVDRRDACPTGPGAVLVTYNGRTFDVPLIDTRYQFHRLRSPFDGVPHVDMLFPARRLWKRRHGGAGIPPAAESCALTALERDILGLRREDDVPGWEIPARYFGYARTGDARGLEAVLEHNRLDLLSLGAVSAVILEMVAEGAEAVRERPDCLALGRLLESLGRIEDAERCFCAAAEADGLLEAELDRCVRAEALHWLAVHRRRGRRFQDAADAWEKLAGISGLDAERKREALEALAIHHEHRSKDLGAARTFALSALQLAGDARRVDEVRHRLGRLSRKLSTDTPDAPQLGLDRL